MSYALDNTTRRSVVASWGTGPGEIQGFGPLFGLVYFLNWQYPVEEQSHIVWVQFFVQPGGGTNGFPLPGATPDYSYDMGQYNTILGITLDMMGGRPVEFEGGYVVLSTTGATFTPPTLVSLGAGTMIFSTREKESP